MEAIRRVDTASSALLVAQKSAKKTEQDFATKDVTEIKVEGAGNRAAAEKIKKLQAREQAIIAHERMHQATGGANASHITYIYERGPDGRQYVSGGEVSFKVPVAQGASETIQSLERVRAASANVADPSPQDLATAGHVASLINSIKTKIAQHKAEQAYQKNHEHTLECKEECGDYVSPVSKFKFQKISAFELFI